jgi:hypothetical protein
MSTQGSNADQRKTENVACESGSGACSPSNHNAGFSLFPGFTALPQYRARYFHGDAQTEKDRPDPDVLRSEKYQQAAQDKQ